LDKYTVRVIIQGSLETGNPMGADRKKYPVFHSFLRPKSCALRPLFALCTLHLALTLFAGCYNYEQELTLNRDGSGTLRVLIEHEQIGLIGDPQPRIRERASQTCTDTHLDLEEIQGVELLSCRNRIEDYMVLNEVLYSFEKVDVLSTRGWSYSWDREGSFKVLRIFYDTGEDEPSEHEKEKALREMAGYRGARFTVNLPKSIDETNGAMIEGNKATWDFPWETVIEEGLTKIEMEAKVKLNSFQRIFGW
jgi:hypothetical protein